MKILKQSIRWLVDQQWGFLFICLVAAPWAAALIAATVIAWIEYTQISLIVAVLVFISFGTEWKNWRMRHLIKDLSDSLKFLSAVSDAHYLERKTNDVEIGYTIDQKRYQIKIVRSDNSQTGGSGG